MAGPQVAGGRRPALELGGLAAGLVAGLCLALGLMSPASPRHPAAAPAGIPRWWCRARRPPTPPRLTRSGPPTRTAPRCADWAGGDGVSAIRLNSSQLAWFFSDTYLGPAGPDIGLLAHQRLREQLGGHPDHGRPRQFVRHHDRRRCLQRPRPPGPGRPGGGGRRLRPAGRPTGTGTRTASWSGGTVVKFYNRYLAGSHPFMPVGTVIATFGVSQLSSAGHGPAYGAVARPP